ncbi:XrtA/PEP-CTERM system TPR-repeat protein PrsT [Colwellia psychrerythraea]|uniref:PEP-CTERM system TPR-repeat lipoprotein n=1 Tax=Colwellia psychrerythraea TaxID=28229 RepID=A0A099L606_COLPS|nr:XrtA/PEP-CTERM system TPR-repeat protein PrsT [Colwellia psychrerythraea]KGJ97328.1 PEP-CTERM system TPR-repeat lipoprotein [Colwellia psychrerythraea]
MNKIILTSAITLALNLTACSEQKTPEQLVASANQYSQQGKLANAIIDYKNAVRLDSKNADARLGLGTAYLKQGNYISAEKELDRAVELGAEHAQTAMLLAQVKSRLNKPKKVEQLVALSGELNDEIYQTLLSYAGISTLANSEISKAQDYFAQAAAINPTLPFSQLSQAYLLYIERNFTQALQVNTRLLTEHSDFSEASLLQGYLHFALSNYEQANTAFTDYLTAYPLDYNIKFFQVNTLIKAGEFEQASKVNDGLLKVFKNSALALQYKAQIEYQHGNYIEARELASQALGLDESYVIAKMIAGISSYKLDEMEQAYDYLIGLESMLPATHPINVILLSIKIKLGHTDDISSSVAKLNAIKNSDSDADLLQITSSELMKAGDFASAQSLLNKATQVSPRNANIQVQRGALLLSQRDLSGVKSLEHALSIDPSLHDTEFALARQYINGSEIVKAQAIANKWLMSESYQVSGNILSGLIAMQLEKVAEAKGYFQQALRLEPDSISALYNLASVAAYNKEMSKAISGFKQVIERNPNHHNAIRRYSVLQAREDKATQAISFLSALNDQSKLNDKVVHKNLVIGLAQNLRISGQIAEAIELLESIKLEKNLPARYWSVLAESYQQGRQFEEALSTYDQAIKVQPRSYIIRVGYISVLDKLKQYPQALTMTRVANIDFPHDSNLMIMLAYLELANNNIQAAKQQLQVLEANGISNYLVMATKAKAAMQEKAYPQAIELYSDIYQQTPRSGNAINLARALQFAKQGSEAETVLEQYLVNESSDNRVRMLLAELYGFNNIDNSNSAKIIKTYEEVVAAQPNNVPALNNLAWQQYQSSDLNNAQLNIEKALTLAPDNNSILESYGVILVANKRYIQGIEVLNKVINKGSKDVSAKVSLAEAYIAVNSPEQAKVILTGLSAHDSKLNVKIAKLRQQVDKSQ